MRNLCSAIVNGIAALFAANGGAPHPIVATEPTRRTREPKRPRR